MPTHCKKKNNRNKPSYRRRNELSKTSFLQLFLKSWYFIYILWFLYFCFLKYSFTCKTGHKVFTGELKWVRTPILLDYFCLWDDVSTNELVNRNITFKVRITTYLVAGAETKALTIGGVKGDPFINDDQPGTCPEMFRGIWLYRPFTYPGHIYADVSKTFLAMQASTTRWRRFPAAKYYKQVLAANEVGYKRLINKGANKQGYQEFSNFSSQLTMKKDMKEQEISELMSKMTRNLLHRFYWREEIKKPGTN